MINQAVYADPIIIGPEVNATMSIIWLHGLGADGHDFVPIVELLDMPDYRFILPHAPVQAVTINNGHPMPAWYDIVGLTMGSQEDAAGITQSQSYIASLIKGELEKGMRSEQIVLAGFSQGGAIALYTALRYQAPLAGIIALSTYLPLKNTLANEQSIQNKQTPIFMAHGSNDDVISLSTNIVSRDVLLALDYDVRWHQYAIGHTVSLALVQDIRAFLSHLKA